jgi:hypothetical protein
MLSNGPLKVFDRLLPVQHEVQWLFFYTKHVHMHAHVPPPHTHTHLSYVTQLREGSLSRTVVQWNMKQNTGIHLTVQCNDLMVNIPTKTYRVNPLPVQFKSLLPGQEGCVFFRGDLNTHTCHYVLLR